MEQQKKAKAWAAFDGTWVEFQASINKKSKAYKKESSQRRYRQAHKKEIAESQRRYRQAHKKEIAESQRRYYQAHKKAKQNV